jgi:predicted ArsR family transcriptional regulator
MVMLHGNQRFFASTRGQIVTLLRRGSRTVNELAQILDLTDNAVRAHLATLERDGFVRQQGARRGSGKPSFVYELAPEAEQLFPKAYSLVLTQLLDVLSKQMTAAELDALMRRVGSSIAAQRSIPPGDLRTRLEIAVEALNDLGGLTELEEQDGTYTIRGYSCPLAAVVPGHPQVCHLAETLLTELVGVPIQEHCDRRGSPRCCFVVANS